MLFNSFSFLLIFLPITLFVTKRLKGNWLLFVITMASFIFYAFAGHWWFLIPMAVTTLLDFYLAIKIENVERLRTKRVLLLFSLVGNLGLLFYFKYAGLFLKTTLSVVSLLNIDEKPAWLSFFNVILPAGISFYTFQTLSYIIDVYRGDSAAERNLFRFTSFVSFFPHLVAGPLTRHDQLIPGLRKIAENGIDSRWREAVFLFSIGLSKKVLIADRIGNYIDPLLANTGQMGMVRSWLTILGYTMQIYFDFSGYSDMAIGLGRLFNIELPQNFNNPYRSLNPSEFWKRWHITLSCWFRDYLYITLGGNRCSSERQKFNLVCTMVLAGLWHGAQWTFAAWGLLHGLALIIYHQYDKRWDAWNVHFQRILMFLIACFGWVLFRAKTFSEAWVWFAGLFGFRGIGSAQLSPDDLRLLLLVVVALGVVNFRFTASSFQEFNNLGKWQQIVLGFITAIAIMLMNHSSKFLYFQF